MSFKILYPNTHPAKIINNIKYFNLDFIIGFFEKMASTRVRVLLYYYGMIQNDETGVQYSHPANRMIRISSSLSRQELWDHLYSSIPIDKEKYEIKLK